MYLPPAFRVDEIAEVRAMLRAAPLANLVSATADGLIATPLPLFLDESEGEHGTLYGHVARANPHWKSKPGRRGHGDLHGAGRLRDAGLVRDQAGNRQGRADLELRGRPRLWPGRVLRGRRPGAHRRDAAHQPARRPAPGPVGGLGRPGGLRGAQLRGIVGLRMPVTRIDAKRKMSQNRNATDRAGVVAGLTERDAASDRAVAALVPK